MPWGNEKAVALLGLGLVTGCCEPPFALYRKTPPPREVVSCEGQLLAECRKVCLSLPGSAHLTTTLKATTRHLCDLGQISSPF